MNTTDISEKSPLELADHQTGMTVPEGYFECFNAQMARMLPKQEWEEDSHDTRVMPKSFWRKVRPYVYMAAMFAGIWCMMNMFDMIRATTVGNADVSLSSPELISAINNDNYFSDYTQPAMTESDFYDDLYESGFSTDDITY